MPVHLTEGIKARNMEINAFKM